MRHMWNKESRVQKPNKHAHSDDELPINGLVWTQKVNYWLTSTSINNSVGFKYIFASDEYQQEYPCNFQDVFAILIKEVGTADPFVNIALVPDSSSLISTNSIHPEILNGCDAANETFFEGYNIFC